MTLTEKFIQAASISAAMLVAIAATAQTFPAPKEGAYILKDFKFHTGEVMPELRMNYTTVGDPKGEPVLVMHGTTGSGTGMLNPAYGGQLFGSGQPLDATKYFIILPDSVGTGKSSKPSDGLKAAFPRYNYNDTVDAQYRLINEHFGIKKLRLVTGNSMGGMQTWVWGTRYPEMMDALMPMASQPTAMSSRNWMMRRLITDSIRNDPEWMGGNYTKQPRSAAFASVFYGIGTNGGNQALAAAAPTAAAANRLLDARLAAPYTGDANNHLYQWDSSRDYDPSPDLEKIKAALLVVNSADDERNPPETGLMDAALKRVPGAKYHLIPGSPETAGHGTAGQARFYKDQLAELLRTAPRR